ncbi:hypothetical protein LSAT2_018088 [Lamellibrachia satsuma]|nr:hypothetical protein LSAT2_018088 [Lamellibrachia satsuma]
MPPKKKQGGGKTTGKDDGDLPIEQKYKKALEEIETLKEMLSITKEMTEQTQSVSNESRERTLAAEQALSKYTETQSQVNADISRQYKTMQTEVGLRNNILDWEKLQVKTRHDHTRKKLKQTQQEKNRLCEEKDEEIANQRVKIASMGTQYESVLMDSLDNLVDKMDTAKQRAH